MSEQLTEDSAECGMCGRAGFPKAECEMCHGNQRYAQKRHFTLTEERQGLNKEERQDRYGPFGGVAPKLVDLPGSMQPYSNKPSNTAQ